MKKLLLVLTVIFTVSAAHALPTVNEKVLKAFSIAFPGVENPKWHETKDYYEAYFTEGEVKCHVRLDASGKILSTLRYYGEKMVAPFLKLKLAAKFPGKTIYGVTEVNTEDELTYHVILEDAKTWTHVAADGTGQMEVTSKFKKCEQ